jgi:hypothetical protein
MASVVEKDRTVDIAGIDCNEETRGSVALARSDEFVPLRYSFIVRQRQDATRNTEMAE